MNEQFMLRAIELALQNISSGHGGPFAAVIARDGQIIAEGANSVTSTNDPTAHAEIVAIRAACRAIASFQLTGCEIYATCEPCPMCLGAIYWARPAHLYYAATAADAAAAGFDDAFIYQQILVPPPHRSIPMTHIMAENCLGVFATWKQSQIKIDY